MDEQRENNGRVRDEKGRWVTGRWKPGESGNPAGRPRVSLTAALREYLEAHPKELEALAKSIVQRGKKGSASHAAILFDRIDGRVKDDDGDDGSDVFLRPPERLRKPGAVDEHGDANATDEDVSQSGPD